MPRPRTNTTGPLANMTVDEIAAVAKATGASVTSVDRWRRNLRPGARKCKAIAETLHECDPERWPDPTGLADRLREMEAGR